ncbi:hypothetical protein [Phenylobacterium sp.]|uniref:head-tail connector protein n=1 Tax=Phenylobacterium sp. TaxID=1871053 RepID=UPI00301CB14F
MWNRLVRVSAPIADALSLEDARSHLNLTGVADHDGVLAGFIADAIATFEGPSGIGVCLIEQTWRLSLDRWPARIDVPLGPVSAVVDVTYLDPIGAEQPLDPDDYVFDLDRRPLRIWPAEGVSWPAHKVGPGAIKVTFKAGFGPAAADLPADIVGALKVIVGQRFENRGSDALPAAAEAVIERYRRGRVG